MKNQKQKLSKESARQMNEAARSGQQAISQRDSVVPSTKKKKKPKQQEPQGERRIARTPTKVARQILGPATSSWARSLADSRLPPVKCPFNFNPVPSTMSFVATTTCSRPGSLSCAAGAGLQLMVFPGHGLLDEITVPDLAGTGTAALADFDEVAYHYRFQASGAGGVSCHGPAPFFDTSGLVRPASAAFFVTTAAGSVNPSTASSSVMPWDAPLPFNGDVRNLGHLRVKLTSLRLELINVTPELSRGGSIVTVQPASVSAVPATVAELAINPSWTDHGPDKATIQWTPRLRDLAYWHPSDHRSSGTGLPVLSNDVASAGILAFFTAPAAAAQTYDVAIIAHWELSGYAVQTLSTQAKSSVIGDSVLKGAIAAHTMTQSGARGFAETLHAGASAAMGIAPRVLSAAGAVAGAVKTMVNSL